MTGRYRIEGLGSDLRLRIAGPDEGACLAAAVRGFAEAVAGAPPPAAPPRGRRAVHLDEDAAPDLLVALLDHLVLLLDAEGLLACDLAPDAVAAGRLRGHLSVARIDDLALDGVTPKAATWHDLHLGPDGDGWVGRVVLDL